MLHNHHRPGRLRAVFLLLLATSVSAAEPAPEPANGNDVTAAKQHFIKGNRLFDLQRYSESAREYEAAYEAKDDPALLFNIGQAYRLAADYPKAIGAYKAYLRRSPHPHNRAEIEARIADLQKLLAAQVRTHEAPPVGNETVPEQPSTHEGDHVAQPRPAPITESQPWQHQPERSVDANAGRVKRLAGIGLLAGGGAAIVVGATLTGLAYAIQSAQSHPGRNVAYDPSAASRMTAEETSGGVLLGVGAAAAVGGTVLYVLGRKEASRGRFAIAPIVGGGVTGLMVTGEAR
jgi:tetratricopeptide (TPR) repeat protein